MHREQVGESKRDRERDLKIERGRESKRHMKGRDRAQEREIAICRQGARQTERPTERERERDRQKGEEGRVGWGWGGMLSARCAERDRLRLCRQMKRTSYRTV